MNTITIICHSTTTETTTTIIIICLFLNFVFILPQFVFHSFTIPFITKRWLVRAEHKGIEAGTSVVVVHYRNIYIIHYTLYNTNLHRLAMHYVRFSKFVFVWNFYTRSIPFRFCICSFPNICNFMLAMNEKVTGVFPLPYSMPLVIGVCWFPFFYFERCAIRKWIFEE